jgi:Amt family ammonium transporter
MSVLWVFYGYSIAFDGTGMLPGTFNFHSLFGGMNKVFLSGVGVDSVSGSIPETVFIIFQMTFAIITPALMVGAFAERMKFSAVMLFVTIWFTLSYLPICHMAWGGDGALFANWGVLDFAGGTVVHVNAGIAALVACLMVGKRKGFGEAAMLPHNVPFVIVGTGMLWVGWFGFNAGSELAADGTAGMAMLVTQISTATAALSWMFVEWARSGKPTAVGIATGAVAGLVAITPASGTAGPMGAILIGFLSGSLCYFSATSMKRALGYDDSLDVFGVHGIGGIIGAAMTGFCAAEFMGGAGIEAASVGAQVWAQIKSIIVTIVWSGSVAFVSLKIIDAVIGLRTETKDEEQGLDISDHEEAGYNLS